MVEHFLRIIPGRGSKRLERAFNSHDTAVHAAVRDVASSPAALQPAEQATRGDASQQAVQACTGNLLLVNRGFQLAMKRMRTLHVHVSPVRQVATKFAAPILHAARVCSGKARDLRTWYRRGRIRRFECDALVDGLFRYHVDDLIALLANFPVAFAAEELCEILLAHRAKLGLVGHGGSRSARAGCGGRQPLHSRLARAGEFEMGLSVNFFVFVFFLSIEMSGSREAEQEASKDLHNRIQCQWRVIESLVMDLCPSMRGKQLQAAY